jgi:hypothetical protein
MTGVTFIRSMSISGEKKRLKRTMPSMPVQESLSVVLARLEK